MVPQKSQRRIPALAQSPSPSECRRVQGGPILDISPRPGLNPALVRTRAFAPPKRGGDRKAGDPQKAVAPPLRRAGSRNMNPSHPQKALWRAKRHVRQWKREGRTGPPTPPLFDHNLNTGRVRAVAEQNQYNEPWASYLAPFQIRARDAQ